MIKPQSVLSIQTADNVGGAAGVGWQLGKGLAGLGVDVKFIVSRKVTNSDRVYQLKSNPFLGRFPKVAGKDWNSLFASLRVLVTGNDVDLGADEEILTHPYFQQADVVQLHNLHGNYFRLSNLIPISRQKKTVWTLHDMWAIMPHGGWSNQEEPVNGFYHRENLLVYPPVLFDDSTKLREKKRVIYEQADLHIIVPSFWLLERVRKSILARFTISLIHYGIDTRIFKPPTEDKTTLKKRLKLPEHKRIILFLAIKGPRNYQKGWSYLKHAFDRLPQDLDALLLCVGGERFVDRSREERVLYLPHISDETTIASYLGSSDVFVLPSVFENLPLTVLQSMACGTPVVAFDVGGVGEMVEHLKTGYLAKYKNTTDLLNGIKYILTLQPERLKQITTQALAMIQQNFTSEIMADGYLKLYTSLLNSHIND